MKKVFIGISLLITLLYIGSCDNGKDEAADRLKSAYALRVINDSMSEVSVPLITNFSETEGTVVVPDMSRLSGNFENDEKTLSIKPGIAVEGELPGIRMTVTLTEYKPALKDGVEISVTGSIEMCITFDLPGSIIVVANTPEDQPLQFTGGELDGKLAGFKNVKMTFDVSSDSSSDNGISAGSPVAVSGTVYLNGLPAYVDQEILDLMIAVM